MENTNRVRLGVIADDFTGAADAASFLTKQGAKTILLTKIPDSLNHECECVVIALKSRSVEPEEAIKQTKRAVDFLKSINTERYYFKYCSTFDSTPRGNIGVVLDFLLDYLGLPYTVICPSLPVNGRTVKNGVLYVNGVKLSESPMKDHPLNPMWSSYIPTLMKDQSKHGCFVATRENMTEVYVRKILEQANKEGKKFYLVPDYETDSDGRNIAELTSGLKLLSGGSGLLEHLVPANDHFHDLACHSKKNARKSIILCGSCSRKTKMQISEYIKNGGVVYPVDSKKLLDGSLSSEDIANFIRDNEGNTVLVYSDAINKDLDSLRESDTFGAESKMMEQLMADLSDFARQNNFARIVVAGGETSGAVTMKLGYDSYFIGDIISPGIPTLIPVDNAELELILKSGNFGEEDFFVKLA